MKQGTNNNFKIQVSDDKLAVYLTDLHAPVDGNETVTLDHILSELKSKRIIADVDVDNIHTLLSTFTTETSHEKHCIAKGVAAVNGEDGDLIFHIPENYIKQGCAIVLPNDLIATYIEATTGSQGKDVFGNTIAPTQGKKTNINIGTGITTHKTDAGTEYRSSMLGIFSITDDPSHSFNVNSLLHISEDNMEACMNIFAETAVGQQITLESILAELTSNKITQGIDKEIIQFSLNKAQHLSSNKPLACVENVLVAAGTQPQPGKDASLVISHKDNHVGTLLANGFIDFHELGYPWNVSQGDRIGYLFDAKPGVDGITIHGITLKVAKPKVIKCKLEGITKDEKGRLIADLDGALIISGNNLKIVDLLVISSDVGPKTGNIHSKIPVHVKGHIEPGFILESEKEIIIDKNIEDATVRSGSSILIKGGIRGMKSRVYSPSDVRVSFVENASIYLNGDLLVNGSIINSIVASNGAVSVGDQKVKHSMVVGGELTVNKHLEVTELGSDAYFKTIVRTGIAQEERREIILLDKELDEVNEKLLRIKQIEYNHKMTPKDDTKEVLYKLAIVKNALLKDKQQLEDKKNNLITQLKDTTDTRVVIKKCVYPGAIIFINDCYNKVNTKLEAGSFIYDKESDRVIYVPEH